MSTTITNPPNHDSSYMLFFRGPDWDAGQSPEETQRVMDKVMVWMQGLEQQGVVRGGHPLAREGKLISGKKRTVADGPFAESKEVIGGYLLIEVDSLATATAIARECPTLDHGIAIEVRPMLSECPIAQRLRAHPALVAA